MSGFQSVVVCGRVGKDPETKVTPGGFPICQFSVATGKKQKDGSEKTEWHTIKALGKTAELCQKYVIKGREILVQGELETDSWDDKATGQKKTWTKILANQVTFIGSKPAAAGAVDLGGAGAQDVDPAGFSKLNDPALDCIPF